MIIAIIAKIGFDYESIIVDYRTIMQSLSETRISWTIGWILLRYNGVVKVMPSDILPPFQF